MRQPVRLSHDLVCDARQTAKLSNRSMAGQIEFWAQLGRALEPLLQGDRAMALRRAGEDTSLAELIGSVDTPIGRRRVRDYLASRPYPHFEPVAGRPGLLKRIEEDGTETVGRFVNRVFEAVRS